MKQIRYGTDHTGSVNLLTLEILHNVQELIVNMRTIAKLGEGKWARKGDGESTYITSLTPTTLRPPTIHQKA